jgi:hypothetical protein
MLSVLAELAASRRERQRDRLAERVVRVLRFRGSSSGQRSPAGNGQTPGTVPRDQCCVGGLARADVPSLADQQADKAAVELRPGILDKPDRDRLAGCRVAFIAAVTTADKGCFQLTGATSTISASEITSAVASSAAKSKPHIGS